jgi:SAM-dependent methyltransferase
MSTHDFYRSFEDRHRGPREEIARRQRVYVPFLDGVRSIGVPAHLLDLGCGRGEWLEVARDAGWQAEGVDSDEGMLAACRDAGLDVRSGDAIEFLRDCADASAGAISALHVVEHLPFEVLFALVREAMRVLAPGGLLVLETPNPENLVVGTSAFYMDPTHARPLPPALLSFVAEYVGFERVATLRLHENLAPGQQVTLNHVLAAVSPDYAVVAQKPGASSDALDALFARKTGIDLYEMADRWEEPLRQLKVDAHLAREAATKSLFESRELAVRVQEVERRINTGPMLAEHAIDRMFQAIERMEHLEGRLQAMQASTSWRVTRPLRWAGERRLEMRQSGLVAMLRGMVGDALRAVGLRKRIETAPVHVPAPPPAVPLTAAAERVQDVMLHAARDEAPPGKDR